MDSYHPPYRASHLIGVGLEVVEADIGTTKTNKNGK